MRLSPLADSDEAATEAAGKYRVGCDTAKARNCNGDS